MQPGEPMADSYVGPPRRHFDHAAKPLSMKNHGTHVKPHAKKYVLTFGPSHASW